MSRPRTHLFGAFFLGFAALLAQIILIRELMSNFMGTELVAGLVLAGRLFWVGLGGLAAPLSPSLGSRHFR